MKCSKLIEILASNIHIYGDMDIQISVLTDNTDITQDLRDYDWGISEKEEKFVLNFEVNDIKKFKKQLI